MRIAFLDRDGTIIHEPTDTKLPTAATFRMLPYAIERMKKLQDDGYKLVIVSNQGSGSPQSYRESSFAETQEMLEKECEKHGITFFNVFMCPHTDADACVCRKPKTGMVDAFLELYDIDLGHSVMVGDRPTDGEFAKNIGVRWVKAESNKEFPAV